MQFALGNHLDLDRLTDAFAETGRVQIEQFLQPDVAAALAGEVAARDDWQQVLNAGDKVYELSRSVRADMDPKRAAAIDDAVYEGARHGFQYRFESIRTPDDDATRATATDSLTWFARWLSNGPARDVLHLTNTEIGRASC